MVHHLLLLLLLLLNRARRWLLLLLLLAGLPLRLIATLAAGVPETPTVGLILSLATKTAKQRLPFKKDSQSFFAKIYVSRNVQKKLQVKDGGWTRIDLNKFLC